MQKEIEIFNIVERNKDVEHIVHAACQYGHHGFGEKNFKKLFSMLVSTDIHECPKQLQSAIEYLNDNDALDCGICLGDLQARNYVETDGSWYSDVVKQAKKEFYTVLGNHDVGNSKDVAIAGTSQMAFEKFVLPSADKIGVKDLKTPYYLKTFDQYKIALIVLNNYEAELMGEDGNYLCHRGMESYSQTQIDWLIRTLAEIPQEYHLIMAMHSFPYETESKENAFTQLGARIPDEKMVYGNDNLVSDIINAWINGGALKKEYPPLESDLFPILKADCDFTARGEGDFVCYLTGHVHKDIIATCAKYPNQTIVCLASSANDDWQNYDCDLARAEGTKAEDVLTAFSVHTEKRQIRLVRIGSNVTMDLRDRTYTIIEY